MECRGSPLPPEVYQEGGDATSLGGTKIHQEGALRWGKPCHLCRTLSLAAVAQDSPWLFSKKKEKKKGAVNLVLKEREGGMKG